MTSDVQELAKLFANTRSYSGLCQVITTSGVVSGNVSGCLLAAIHDDARIRELGRYGVKGDGPSTEAVPIWSEGLVAKALKLKKPTLIGNLSQLASESKLTPESDIDNLVLQNNFQATMVIPMLENGLLYGVLGVLYNEEPKQVHLNINEDLFQSLMQLVVKAVALTTPVTSIRTEENFDLTVRESNVLALLAQDKTNKEIAIELKLFVATIKATVTTLLKKLKVSSRKHAATRARSSRLV